MESTLVDILEEERMRDLNDAARKGSVSTLKTLLQRDPCILHRVSQQTTFLETPLHLEQKKETPLHKSALLGHLEFTKILLARCPELARKLDSFGSTPLHLASAQGHIDIVKELLLAYVDACLVVDNEQRIPLHYAVIRGRRDVVLELIRAKPESLTVRVENGKNILHLCVMYNHLEILKELEAFTHYDTNNLLIERDSNGKNNTILHLAIMLKQVETVRYLMSIPKIRSGALNLKNNMGYSATDIVARLPKDSENLEMKIVMEFGIDCEKNKEKKWWKRYVFNRIDDWLVYNGERLEQMRGNICTVASVISTISFQAALNPPGSVIQQNILPSNSSDPSFYTFSQGPLGCLPSFIDVDGKNHTKGPCPGEAISSYTDPKSFKFFQLSNTISFLASVWIALLLVLGVRLDRRFVSWMVSQGMGLSISCLISSYLLGVRFVSPIEQHQYEAAIIITICIVNGLHALLGIYVSVKMVMEAVTKKSNKQGKVGTSP